MEETIQKIKLYNRLWKTISIAGLILSAIFGVLYFAFANFWFLIGIGISSICSFFSPIIFMGLIEKEVSARYVDPNKMK